jgi:chromosome segregation ATPase
MADLTDLLNSGGASCKHCGQDLTGEALETHNKNIADRLESVRNNAYVKWQKEVTNTTQEIASLTTKINNLASFVDGYVGGEDRINGLQGLWATDHKALSDYERIASTNQTIQALAESTVKQINILEDRLKVLNSNSVTLNTELDTLFDQYEQANVQYQKVQERPHLLCL